MNEFIFPRPYIRPGVPKDPSSYRVWSGLPTRGYLNVVALLFSRTLCTGVVVANNVVMTAAHCVCDDRLQEIDIGNFADDPANKRIPAAKLRTVAMRECDATTSTPADVAIIRLASPLPANIKPVVFATPGTINDAVQVRAVGFGQSKDPHQNGQKLYVDIATASSNCAGSVQPQFQPQKSDADWYGCAVGFELVAGAPLTDKDTCHGDSGGPIFYHADNGQGGYDEFLVGITSRGVNSPNARECGDGGIYERIDGEAFN